jgi:hypothetical protein
VFCSYCTVPGRRHATSRQYDKLTRYVPGVCRINSQVFVGTNISDICFYCKNSDTTLCTVGMNHCSLSWSFGLPFPYTILFFIKVNK